MRFAAAHSQLATAQTKPKGNRMLLTAVMAMVAADAFDRHRREQQYHAWVAAEEARARVTGATPLFTAPALPAAFDPRRPERPT